jgi:hypothetical protein
LVPLDSEQHQQFERFHWRSDAEDEAMYFPPAEDLRRQADAVNKRITDALSTPR